MLFQLFVPKTAGRHPLGTLNSLTLIHLRRIKYILDYFNEYQIILFHLLKIPRNLKNSQLGAFQSI